MHKNSSSIYLIENCKKKHNPLLTVVSHDTYSYLPEEKGVNYKIPEVHHYGG